VLGAVGLILFTALWELACRLNWLNTLAVSSPSQIGQALVRQWIDGELPRDLQISLSELATGLVLATAAGLVLAAVMGLDRTVEHALDPFIWGLYAGPLVAFYGLIVVWVGFGFWTVVTLIVLMAFVPVTVNTLAGIRSVDPLLVRVACSFGARQLDVMVRVVLPASLPLVLTGIRIAISRALIGLVVGEMFSANFGLGFRLTYYGARLQMADALVPVIAIIVIGVLMTQAVRLLEHRAGRWRRA